MGIQPSNGSKKEQKLGLNNEVISRGQIFNNQVCLVKDCVILETFLQNE